MKKLIKNFNIIILIMMSFTFTQCELFEDLDTSTECGEELELIERTFQIYVTVTEYGQPYEGPIKINIHKQYCDGTKKGYYEEIRTSNSDGYVRSINAYTYKFANKHDKVVITAGSSLGNEGRWYQNTREIYYSDALDYYTGIRIDIQIGN